MPSQGHPAYGSVRAIVKDSTDSAFELTYLDSDGRVDSNETRTAGAAHVDVNDGDWHMITLVTLPHTQGNTSEGGFILFIDGDEEGKLVKSVQLPNSTLMAVPTGGDPALMNTDIFLCARSDLSSTAEGDRYFDGAVAHLAVWDAALTPLQIKAVYETYNPARYAVKEENMLGIDEIGTTSEAALQLKDEGMFASGAGAEYVSAAAAADDSSTASAGLVAVIVMVSVAAAAAIAVALAMAVRAVRRRHRATTFTRFYDNDPAITGGGGGGDDDGSVAVPSGGGGGSSGVNAFGAVSAAERGYGYGGGGGNNGGTTKTTTGLQSSSFPSSSSSYDDERRVNPYPRDPVMNIQLSSSGKLNSSSATTSTTHHSRSTSGLSAVSAVNTPRARSGNPFSSPGASTGADGSPPAAAADDESPTTTPAPSTTAATAAPPSSSVRGSGAKIMLPENLTSVQL